VIPCLALPNAKSQIGLPKAPKLAFNILGTFHLLGALDCGTLNTHRITFGEFLWKSLCWASCYLFNHYYWPKDKDATFFALHF